MYFSCKLPIEVIIAATSFIKVMTSSSFSNDKKQSEVVRKYPVSYEKQAEAGRKYPVSYEKQAEAEHKYPVSYEKQSEVVRKYPVS